MFQKRRVVLLVGIIFVGMLAAIGISFKFQVLDYDTYVEKASEMQNRTIPLKAVRGEILDRNERPLAINRLTYRMYCNVGLVKNVDEFAKEFAPLVHREVNDVANEINEAISNGISKIRLVDGLSMQDAELVLQKGNNAVEWDLIGDREYPNGKLASQIVGFANDNGGGSGLELTLNNILTGTDGELLAKTDFDGRKLPDSQDIITEPVNGTDIKLTIDTELQYELEQILDRTYHEYEAIRTSGIIMDVTTGEIYAMANMPTYDLNNPGVIPKDLTSASMEQYIVEDQGDTLQGLWNLPQATMVYEPGSILKIISAAIALEENVVDLHEKFMCRGYSMVDGYKLLCWKGERGESHGEIDFTFGFADSCNVVFIEMFDRLKIQDIYKYYEKFGLTDKTALPISGEANSLLQDASKVTRVDKATYSYGHGNNYTMLQVAQAVAATINGGYLYEPHIIKEYIDTDGNVEEVKSKTVRQVISSSTSDQMKFLMEEVMRVGSGKKFNIEGIRLGGKSGSSLKYNPETKDYTGNGIVASFVEVAPMDNPKYMVFIVMDKPQGAKDQISGSQVAGPVATEVMRKTLDHFGLINEVSANDDYKITVPQFENLSYADAMDKLKGLNIPYVITNEDFDEETARVIKQFPAPGSKMSTSFKIRLTFGD